MSQCRATGRSGVRCNNPWGGGGGIVPYLGAAVAITDGRLALFRLSGCAASQCCVSHTFSPIIRALKAERVALNLSEPHPPRIQG